MKSLILLFGFLYSFCVSASSLVTGYPFNLCDSDGKGPHQDYFVQFMKDGTEFEAEMYLSPDKKNCGGEHLFSIGRIWNYEVHGNELSSVLKEAFVIVSHPRIIPIFNKNKFCEKTDWKLEEKVKCTGLNIFGYEPLAGHRTIHQFSVNGIGLHVIQESGEKLILGKMGAE